MTELLALFSGGSLAIGKPLVLVIAIVFIFSIVMVFISWKTGKSFSFSLGPLKLALGGKKKTKEEEEKEESDEPTVEDSRFNILLFIDGVGDFMRSKVEEIQQLKNVDTLSRQMRFADEKMVEIKSTVTNKYARQLELKLENSDVAKMHKDYRSYQIMIGLLSNDLRDKVVKEAFIENHILDYSESEWEEYINQKTDLIVTMACDFIDIMYDQNNTKLISLKELSVGSQEIIPTVKEMLRYIFRKARFIAIDNQKKMDIIEKEIVDYLNELKGLNEIKKTSVDKQSRWGR